MRLRKEIKSDYVSAIQKRSTIRFLKGLMPRFYNVFKAQIKCSIARFRNAKIGINSNIPFKLARNANANLIVGDNTVIETSMIDLREKVTIGSNVIINKGAKIICQSHDIDSLLFETVGSPIIIEDYVWISTDVLVLPNCHILHNGVVIGAGSVVVKSSDEELLVLGGNPAKVLRKRSCIHEGIYVESLQGRDLKKYWRARYFENIE